MRHADLLECGIHTLTTLGRTHVAIGEWQFDILENREVADEVERLEDESDLAVANARAIDRGKVRDGFTIEVVLAFRRCVEQAKDVQIGQRASIDTRNGIVPGRVIRKDPAAQAGTVTIDVALEGELPAGAVPDLSVDGTIEIENLKGILYTGRPVMTAGTGQVSLFKLVENGDAAVRVQVELGRSSVNTIEIVRGLEVGDKIILSDMSTYANEDRVRIK